jgi:hypothetical protein
MGSQNLKVSKEKNRNGLQVKPANDLTNPQQSTFDRKAEEMKAFLRRNPVPKEFLN